MHIKSKSITESNKETFMAAVTISFIFECVCTDPVKKSLAQNDSNYNTKAFHSWYCLNSIAPFRSQSGFRLRCTLTHAHTFQSSNCRSSRCVMQFFVVAFFELTRKAYTHFEMCEEKNVSSNLVHLHLQNITHRDLRFAFDGMQLGLRKYLLND